MQKLGLHFGRLRALRLVIAIAATVIICSSAGLGSERFHFKTWNTENGLPQNTVHSIAQTRDGYLWVATFDGLARFDGLRFKVFRKSNTPELPTNRLAGLFLDTDGRLWITTEDPKVIVLYENGKFSAFENGRDFQTDDMTAPWRERTVMRMPAGEDEFVFEQGRFIRRKAVVTERNFPRAFWDEQRNAWFDAGDRFVGGKEGQLQSYPKDSDLPFAGRKLWSRQYVEIDGAVWMLVPFAQGARLARFSDGELRLFPAEAGDNSMLVRDERGNLWIVEQFGGLVRIDAATVLAADPLKFPTEMVLSPSDKANSDLRELFFDRDGNLWICSASGLRLLIEDRPVTVFSTKDGLPSDNIYSIVEDRNGKIWFGAWMDHLVGYEGGHFSSEPFKLVSALYVDRDSKLWAGSNDIAYRDGGSWVSFATNLGLAAGTLGEVTVISQDRSGNFWFGSSTIGIVRSSNGAAQTFTVSDGLPGNSVTSFLQTADGTIWVGTASGLARYEDGKFVAYTTNDGLAGNYVRALYEDKEKALWIGTYDSGLSRYKDGKFSTISSRDGLFSDGAFCILEDDNGWFWINSNQGIYRAKIDELNDLADGKAATVNSISYGPKNGLLNVEGNGGKQPAGLRASDGRLWFPTAGGIAVIDPRSVRQTLPPPPVLIEDVTVDQRTMDTTSGRIQIEPMQTSFDISYSAISFTEAESVKFRYRMEGLDENWTEAGTRRTAYFSHLPFGEYTFHVTAANQDGSWNQDGASIAVVIVPPFYRTSLFYALATLAVFGIIGFVFMYRLRELNARNLASAEFGRRLIDSQENERMRIALELHDSIGQSLAVIRNRALIGLSKPDEHRRLLDHMHEISEASAAALKETREIAHNLHPAQLEHLGLAAALMTLVESLASVTDTRFTSKIDETVATLSRDEAINLYRIAQESISNIIKHSGAERAQIQLTETDEKIVLSIEDDGKGMNAKEGGVGLGLKGIRERATMIGAELTIRSTAGNGTRLIVSLPLRHE